MVQVLFLPSGGVLCVTGLLVSVEQHGNAPDSGQPHQRIDDAADETHLATAEKGYDIEAKDADAAPVQGADDRKNQRKFI